MLKTSRLFRISYNTFTAAMAIYKLTRSWSNLNDEFVAGHDAGLKLFASPASCKWDVRRYWLWWKDAALRRQIRRLPNYHCRSKLLLSTSVIPPGNVFWWSIPCFFVNYDLEFRHPDYLPSIMYEWSWCSPNTRRAMSSLSIDFVASPDILPLESFSSAFWLVGHDQVTMSFYRTLQQLVQVACSKRHK